VLVVAACSSGPTETGSGAPPDPLATTTPNVTTNATAGPTTLVIPTVEPGSTSTPIPATVTPTAEATSQPTAVAPTATAEPTATSRPIPSALPTAQPTATPRPIPTATGTPLPATPTPTPTSVWVNPDCYAGPGAADEPVWWCGGQICVVGAPHYGCPSGPPPNPVVQIDCTISDTDIVVNEMIVLSAVQDPVNIPVRYAFVHGDGTIDNTAESHAYYADPGYYDVMLLWQYRGAKGSTNCGRVTVRPITGPTPTPTPAVVQIGCTISPQRTVQVNETLTFTAFQDPTNFAVTYVFDHGDGTLDETSQSLAYYAAPGFYQVVLRWAHSGGSGTTYCGTVTVEPNFNAADYLGRTPGSAEALATSRGLVLRVVRIDDQVFPGTDDYRLDRVNIEVDANHVTEVYLG
jgi:hypothetical protein